jgi:hypothetical protein
MVMFILLWLFFCFLVGLFANQRRNRSGLGWFLIALIISPIVSFLLVVILREAVGAVRITPAARAPGLHWDKLRRKYNAEKAARLAMTAVDAATR